VGYLGKFLLVPFYVFRFELKSLRQNMGDQHSLGGEVAMPVHLAIVDGHTLVRYGLHGLAAQHSDIEIVAECQSAAEAPGMVATAQPDVVTVDVSLPDGDGLRLARELRDRYADLGIVILTSMHEDDVLFRALDTGVSAFVAKTAPLEEVLGAIRHAAVAASSFTASGLATAIARRRTRQDGLSLSPRETQVLRLLNYGLSVPAIALEMYISVSTAKTYVARLYEKLGATSRAQALMTAMHHGLIQYQQDTSAVLASQWPGRQGVAGQRGVAGSLALVERDPE
jgi:DNA-binding NarL/FixJ family response regulator